MPNLKKNAFFISSFRPGGGEKQVIEIANAFAAQGLLVDLLVLKSVGELHSAVDSRIHVVSLDRRRIILSVFPLISYLRRERPAVILALDEYTHLLALFARMLTRSNTRIVLRIGNMLSILFKQYEGTRNSVLPFLVRTFYKKADAIVANSKGVADDVTGVTGIDRNRVYVIVNPKPRAKILEKSKEAVTHPWLIEKTLQVILFSGRLRVQKNLPVLIRAFAAIQNVVPSRLLLAGAGREEGRLKALVSELHIESSVTFLGYIPNPYAYMSKADVFVYPSLWEGMPNSILEAMVCGAPIIASDCSSGPREILAPESDYKKRLEHGTEYASAGVLVAVNDEGALKDALIKILTDSEIRNRYKQASLARSIEFEANDSITDYKIAMGLL